MLAPPPPQSGLHLFQYSLALTVAFVKNTRTPSASMLEFGR